MFAVVVLSLHFHVDLLPRGVPSWLLSLLVYERVFGAGEAAELGIF